MTIKSVLRFIAVKLATTALPIASAYGCGYPQEFLAASTLVGTCQNEDNPSFVYNHDFGDNYPAGYFTYMNYCYTSDPNWCAQTWHPTQDPPTTCVVADDCGGQVYQVSPAASQEVRIIATQADSPIQFFAGQACFDGSMGGWPLFDIRAANGFGQGWYTRTDPISTVYTPGGYNACTPNWGPSYTRFWRGLVTFPFQENGVPTPGETYDTIVSEHYDCAGVVNEPLTTALAACTPANSVNMERQYLVNGRGAVAWEGWSKTVPPANMDGGRCPDLPFGGYDGPAGYHMYNCRVETNLVLAQPLLPLQMWTQLQ